MNDTIALIPARGGSKGVLRKNVKSLAGHPLIFHTINAAIKSKKIDRIFVSTEDDEIAQIALDYGAEVISRPQSLATDTTVTFPVILHAIEYLKQIKISPKILILLQPTSPLRTPQDICDAISLFSANDCKSVVSMCEFEHSPFWSFQLDDNFIRPLFPDKVKSPRRQNLEKSYRPNGAIYVSSPENIIEYNGFFTNKTIAYIMPTDRSIDIDHEIDFQFAEILLAQKK